MTLSLRMFVLAFALAAAGRIEAADIGRVVLAAGDASAVRGGQVVKLAFGAAVQDKDLLRTGPATNLQVRFQDDSFVSMRENSELRIDEFRFSGKGDGGDSAVFGLVKGGFRALTGLIGRVHNEEYKMVTPTATVGIRGTDYAATLCAGDCRNADGSPAKDGLYGRVIGQSHGTNRIEVSNDADRKLLGTNDNFFVNDRRSAVELLLVSPGFVASRPEGRRQRASEGAPGGTGSEQATAGGAAQESRPGNVPDALPQLQFVATQNLNAQGTPAVLTPATGFVVVYPFPFPIANADVLFDDKEGATYNAQNQLLSYGSGGAFPSGSLNGGSITDTGTITMSDGGTFVYGRWTGNTSIVTSSGTISNVPLLFGTINDAAGGNDQKIANLGGTATYTYAGGPKPIDASGNVGSVTSTSMMINFTSRSVQYFLSMLFPSVGTFGSASFSLSGTASPTNSSNSGEFGGSLSGSCAGGGCASGSASGGFSVGLTGPVGYEFSAVGGGVDGTKGGAVVFLNAFGASSFTPGPPPGAGTTGQLAFGNASPSIANTATLDSNQLTLSGSNLVAFGDGATFPSGNLSTGTNIETGSVALVDGSTMNWGRWSGSAQVIGSPGNVSITPGTGVPYVLGAAGAVLPTSGTFLYSYAGGPNPVSTSGTVGTFTGGSFNVGFGATSGTLAVVTPLSMSVGTATYSLTSCTSGCTFTNASPVAGNMSLTGTCGGTCGGTATGNMAAVFVGPQGAGLAVAGNVFATAQPGVAFAAAFKR